VWCVRECDDGWTIRTIAGTAQLGPLLLDLYRSILNGGRVQIRTFAGADVEARMDIGREDN
jgi:hypothetical protein